MINTSRGINWGPASFLIIYQTILLAALPFYFYYSPPTLGMWILTIVLLFATGISITGGYHRYYSHRTYRAHPAAEAVLLFLGTLTAQGSVLRWSYDHRNHHAYVDTDEDPYSINKGFWYAHCLWILEKPRTIEKKIVADLMRNKMVVFQHHYYPWLMVLTNFLVYLAVGWMMNDYLGAFVMAIWVRLFMLHHFTWFINSLAHTWGDKPFCTEQSAVDNYLISLLTFGEGYHNYHHTYANDYRNGIRWYHFDPTKWTIWALSKLGLTHDLKRMDTFTVKKRMVLERKDLLLNQIREHWVVKKDELEKRINEMSEKMLSEIADFKALTEKYLQAKSKNETDLLNKLRIELKAQKKSLKQGWKEWRRFSWTIFRMKHVAN